MITVEEAAYTYRHKSDAYIRAQIANLKREIHTEKRKDLVRDYRCYIDLYVNLLEYRKRMSEEQPA